MVTPIRRPATIRDVARKAGVSVAAVSFALNGTGTLSEQTRVRIRQVADQMNYRANALARGLRRAPIGAIGFVTRPLDAIGRYRPSGVDVFSRTAAAAASAAMDHGLGMLLLPDLMRTPLPPLALSLDGYIVMNPVQDDPVVTMLIDNEIPFVTVGADPSRPAAHNWVSHDEAQAANHALDDLWAAGARRIAYVGGQARDSYNIRSERAYRRWVKAHGQSPMIRHVLEGDGERAGAAACARLLSAAVPDGIYCLTGRHSAGVLAGLREHGLRVPSDVVLAAGSDSEQARSAHPAISAIEIPAEEIGVEAVTQLSALLKGEPYSGGVVPAEYRRRASTLRGGSQQAS